MTAARTSARARAWAILDHLSSRRHATIGASLTRIGFGLASLLFYLVQYADRNFLWGPDGVVPSDRFVQALEHTHSFSLYAWSGSELWFSLVFHAGIAIAVLFTLGWHPRVLTVLHWVFMWSLFERNRFLLDGGDNLLYLALLYLVLVDTSAIGLSQPRPAEPGSLRWRITTLLHHAGIAAIVLQVCFIYLASALFKVQGEMWQNGTALYYIMRVQEFTLPGVSEVLYQNGVFVTLATYGTVLFQVAFPFMLLNRYTRIVAFVGAVGMHAGIAVMMGLLSFSLIMISAEFVIVADRHWLHLAAVVRRATARVRFALRKDREPPLAQERVE